MNFVPGMSNYTLRMTRLSARIFGDVPRPTTYKGMKIVRIFTRKPNDLRPEIVDYYPPHREYSALISTLRDHGLFRDEHLDFKEEMIRLRALRGKVQRKRGEGKKEQIKQLLQ